MGGITIRRIVIAVAITACFNAARAQPHYGWTISSSDTDPFQNVGLVELGHVYLWYVCGQPDGLAAAAFDVSIPDGVLNFGFNPVNGFLNAGGASELVLSVGGCPMGPVVAGYWRLWGQVAGDICLVESSLVGGRSAVDCTAPTPGVWPVKAKGFRWWSHEGAAACDEAPCGPTALDPTTWGRTKALYR